MIKEELVRILPDIPDAILDLRYASENNFTGRKIYDFEDAMLIESAVREKIDCIVTRDPAHFKNSPVAVHDPESFVKWLKR